MNVENVLTSSVLYAVKDEFCDIFKELYHFGLILQVKPLWWEHHVNLCEKVLFLVFNFFFGHFFARDALNASDRVSLVLIADHEEDDTLTRTTILFHVSDELPIDRPEGVPIVNPKQ